MIDAGRREGRKAWILQLGSPREGDARTLPCRNALWNQGDDNEAHPFLQMLSVSSPRQEPDIPPRQHPAVMPPSNNAIPRSSIMCLIGSCISETFIPHPASVPQTGSPEPSETLEHMRNVMKAGVDTFICLQEEVPEQVRERQCAAHNLLRCTFVTSTWQRWSAASLSGLMMVSLFSSSLPSNLSPFCYLSHSLFLPQDLDSAWPSDGVMQLKDPHLREKYPGGFVRYQADALQVMPCLHFSILLLKTERACFRTE